MPAKGKNKYGLNLEDFDSYEDYKKTYDRLKNTSPEKRKWRRSYVKRDYVKDYIKSWFEKNKEKEALRKKTWRENNKEKLEEYNKDYYTSNKEHIANLQSEWKKNNRGKVREMSAAHRARKLKATPKWANMKKIRDIYLNCPKGFEVDHIIPLKGKTVSGLHVENNLQYLTKSENCSKGNKILL